MEVWPEGDQELRHSKSLDTDDRSSFVRNRAYGSRGRQPGVRPRVQYPKLLLYLIMACIGVFLIMDYGFGAVNKLKNGLINDPKRIQKVNNIDKGYFIKENPFFEGVNISQAHDLFSNDLSDKEYLPYCKRQTENDTIIPDYYNFYDNHRHCLTHDVQRKCSSSYVEAHANVFKLRLCAQGVDFTPSIDYMLNCDTKTNEGCTGGYMLHSLTFAKKHGYISQECWDSVMKDQTGCPSRYQLESCRIFHLDKFCVMKGKEAIQREIMANGPVVGQIDPYLELILYEEGIFNYKSKDKLAGNQFMKVVGWGTEEDKEYWIVESMWGKSWGEDGFAKLEIGAKKDRITSGVVIIYPGQVDVLAE